MAKIVLSPEAPSDLNSVSLASAVVEEFPYETADRELIGNAEAHPWLEVEYPEVEVISGVHRETLRPEDDALSAQGPNANDPFDPDKIREVEESKVNASVTPLAVESGLDQDDEEFQGEVAVTLAADDAANDTDNDDDGARF